MRYLRYVRRLRQAERKYSKNLLLEAQKERERIIKEQKKADRLSDLEKQKLERMEMREARKKLQEEARHDPDYHRRVRAEEKARKKRLHEYNKRRQGRLLKVYAKACRRSTIRMLASFNPLRLPGLFAYIRRNKREAREFLIITIHSTLLFTTAYLLIFAITQFTSAISGLFFDYKSVIYHYEVLWLVKPSQWFGDSVKTIYSSGPVVAAVIALFMAIVFSYLRTDRGLAKLFILWSFLHGFNAFLGSLLMGSLFGRGFGHAIIWAYVSDTSKVIYSIVSITALFLLGIFTSKSFLISANTYFPKLETGKQRYFIWAQVIIPFLLGNAIILAVMMPHVIVYTMSVSLCLGIAMIPVAIGYRFSPSLYFEEEDIPVKLRPAVIFYTLAFVFLYRMILGIGIPMGQ